MELAYSHSAIPGALVEGKLRRSWPPPPSPSSVHGFSLQHFYLPLFLPLPRTVVALLSGEVHHPWLLLVPNKTRPLPPSPSLLLLPLLFLSTASSLVHRRGLKVRRRPLSFFTDTLARCQRLPAPSACRRPPSCSLYHHRCRPLSPWPPPPLTASPPLSSLPSPSLLPFVDSGSFFPSLQALAFPPSTPVPSSHHRRSRASLHLLPSPFAVVVLCCRRGLTVDLLPCLRSPPLPQFPIIIMVNLPQVSLSHHPSSLVAGRSNRYFCEGMVFGCGDLVMGTIPSQKRHEAFPVWLKMGETKFGLLLMFVSYTSAQGLLS